MTTKATQAMRVCKIGFRGYQRLVDTSCNTDGKLIAFLGPNEAGKTTVLRALNWFSNGDGELSRQARNRRNPPTVTSGVVEITYWLEKADVDALAEVDLPRSAHDIPAHSPDRRFLQRSPDAFRATEPGDHCGGAGCIRKRAGRGGPSRP